METSGLIIKSSGKISGLVRIVGAKNAVLVVMASLILTRGISILRNVPCSQDVLCMIDLLEVLGAKINFDMYSHTLCVDTSTLNDWQVPQHIMQKMRASVLVMGPLLARFGRAHIALPGGCVIGARPIDYHIKNFKKMGVVFTQVGNALSASVAALQSGTYVLEYPSVGATENLLMAAVCIPGQTKIVNAALEPEVEDLICVLLKMGAKIKTVAPATIIIDGVETLGAIEHAVLADRLEAGSFLLAAAITGGNITVQGISSDTMDVFLLKLSEMGHALDIDKEAQTITLRATHMPEAVSFKTGPYPSFPTDLQAPMMVLQTVARGTSIIEETVFENRMLHVQELQKMGAQIELHYNKAIVTGVDCLHGTLVTATDIRASCALVLAGLIAKGITTMAGLTHFRRGYERLDTKLIQLGAAITVQEECRTMVEHGGMRDREEVSS